MIVSGDGAGVLKLWNLAAVFGDTKTASEKKTRSASQVLMRTHKNVARNMPGRCMSETIRGIWCNDWEIIVGDANGRIILYRWVDLDE